MIRDDSKAPAASDGNDADPVPAPAEQDGDDVNLPEERVISPTTLEAARAVVRHHADRLAGQNPASHVDQR